jgi:hypothetical protein
VGSQPTPQVINSPLSYTLMSASVHPRSEEPVKTCSIPLLNLANIDFGQLTLRSMVRNRKLAFKCNIPRTHKASINNDIIVTQAQHSFRYFELSNWHITNNLVDNIHLLTHSLTHPPDIDNHVCQDRCISKTYSAYSSHRQSASHTTHHSPQHYFSPRLHHHHRLLFHHPLRRFRADIFLPLFIYQS